MKTSPMVAMELFGQAILDRIDGGTEPFYFIVNGVEKERSLDRYLRTSSELSLLEKFLISQCNGNILDVGCGTGNYIPELNKVGNVIGIDVSNKIIECANRLGNSNCYVADIFTYSPDTKFDTVTFFENNFGMAVTDEKTATMVTNLKNILNRGGKVLLMQRDIKEKYRVLNVITVKYKGVTADFEWVQTSVEYVSAKFIENGFSFTEIKRDVQSDSDEWYVAECRVR